MESFSKSSMRTPTARSARHFRAPTTVVHRNSMELIRRKSWTDVVGLADGRDMKVIAYLDIIRTKLTLRFIRSISDAIHL